LGLAVARVSGQGELARVSVMSKPATVAIAVASIGVVALLFFLVRNKDQPSIPGRPPGPAAVAEPTAPEPAPYVPETAEGKPHPAPGTTAAARSALPAPVESNADKPLDEQWLLTELQDLAASDPPRSLKLAREAVKRFPDSPNAPEFEWNVVKALFNMRQIEDAEQEARIMVSKYPDNHFTGDVVHHLLNHPPNP
jgi:hypothetical protein